jgi:CBS domain-containing protein
MVTTEALQICEAQQGKSAVTARSYASSLRFDARQGNSMQLQAFSMDLQRRSQMKVKDAMHKGVEHVAPDALVNAIANKMKELDVGAIPVVRNGELVGMITDRDITIRCVASGKDPTKLTAEDIMTRGVVYCRDTEEVEDAIRIMESKQIRRLPVLDEAKRVVGMISLGDISHALPQDMTGEVTKAVSAHHA